MERAHFPPGRIIRAALAVVDRMNSVVLYACAACLAGMCVATLLQVLVRFALTAIGINISAPWTEEVARYLMIWAIFLGAGVACRRAQLISLEIVVRMVPPSLGRTLKYAGLILCLVFFVVLIKAGLDFVELGYTETSPVMSIRKSYVYAALPVGVALMMVSTLALIAETAIGGKDIRLVGDAEAQE